MSAIERSNESAKVKRTFFINSFTPPRSYYLTPYPHIYPLLAQQSSSIGVAKGETRPASSPLTYNFMRLSQPRGKLDFIDDISGIRHPRAIASYTFCPLFVMLIACYLPDLGAVATAAALFFDLADAVSDPAKIRVFV